MNVVKAMQITIYEKDRRFTFENPRSANICQVVDYAYALADRACQSVYVLAFEVDARDLSTEGCDGELAIYFGREDAALRNFGYGDGVVIWKPGSKQWTRDLMSAHWHEAHLWWGILVDRRDVSTVAQAIGEVWPSGYTAATLHDLLDTVSPDRALVLLACEGSFIDGTAQPEYWKSARSLLACIAGANLDVVDRIRGRGEG